MSLKIRLHIMSIIVCKFSEDVLQFALLNGKVLGGNMEEKLMYQGKEIYVYPEIEKNGCTGCVLEHSIGFCLDNITGDFDKETLTCCPKLTPRVIFKYKEEI